jgi:hypothetical protein
MLMGRFKYPLIRINQEQDMTFAFVRGVKSIALATLAAAALSACLGGGDAETPVTKIATADIPVPITASTVAAIANQEFAFPAGISDPDSGFQVNGDTKLTLTGDSFSIKSSTDGELTGVLSFGSCIFTIKTVPSGSPYVVGQKFEIKQCNINAATGGVVATGQATAVQILLALGQSTSAKRQAQVIIDPNSSIVYVNGVQGGFITLQAATGTGSST